MGDQAAGAPAAALRAPHAEGAPASRTSSVIATKRAMPPLRKTHPAMRSHLVGWGQNLTGGRDASPPHEANVNKSRRAVKAVHFSAPEFEPLRKAEDAVEQPSRHAARHADPKTPTSLSGLGDDESTTTLCPEEVEGLVAMFAEHATATPPVPGAPTAPRAHPTRTPRPRPRPPPAANAAAAIARIRVADCTPAVY